jgi:hypothetical protein
MARKDKAEKVTEAKRVAAERSAYRNRAHVPKARSPKLQPAPPKAAPKPKAKPKPEPKVKVKAVAEGKKPGGIGNETSPAGYGSIDGDPEIKKSK